MENQVTEFYNNWAEQQMLDTNRTRVLKWKAVNFLNLLLRNDFQRFEKVAEIGGAEGILLDMLDKNLTVGQLFNYDISDKFCQSGKLMFPKIDFRTYDFLEKPEKVDLIMLSDITEHVPDDNVFMDVVSRYCKNLVVKIPLEIAFINSKLFYLITLRKKPKNLIYGPEHINGHLRGYDVSTARKLLSKYFRIIDEEITDVACFNPTPLKSKVKRIVGKRNFISIFGGAYFALCESIQKQ